MSPAHGKRWVGFLPVRAEILAQKRFALRSVIAGSRDLNPESPPTFLISGHPGLNWESDAPKAPMLTITPCPVKRWGAR